MTEDRIAPTPITNERLAELIEGIEYFVATDCVTPVDADMLVALRELQARRAAETDCVLVPREPTKKMLKAGKRVFFLMVHDGCVAPIYEAMLSARPTT